MLVAILHSLKTSMFGTLQKWWLVPFHQDDADIVGWPGGLSSSAGDGVVRCGGVGVGAFFVCGKKIKKSEIFFFAKHVHFTSEEHQINCLKSTVFANHFACVLK